VDERALLDWLLEGDPAVRWRTLRDLADADDDTVARERAKVATEGWGARLLAHQDPDGRWDGGVYSPKWTSTTYTLLALAWLGLPPGNPAALRGCDRLWEWQATWRHPETCIAGMLTLVTSAHEAPAAGLDDLVRHLLDRQLDDGGWNCAAFPGGKRKHSSFHTSISALDGLAAYAAAGGAVDTSAAQEHGREFFLRHHLYQSHRTGEVAIPASVRFPLLPQWHFDVLRALEHFAAVDAPRDDRLTDALAVVERARRKDGTWPRYAGYPGRQWFELEPPGPSRWNTLRALRVMRWWEG
jgi:hypothetical protein